MANSPIAIGCPQKNRKKGVDANPIKGYYGFEVGV